MDVTGGGFCICYLITFLNGYRKGERFGELYPAIREKPSGYMIDKEYACLRFGRN